MNIFETISKYKLESNTKSQCELNKFYDDILNYEMTHYIPGLQFESCLFLMQIVKLFKPKRILEIGFGAGVSTLFIDKSLSYQPEEFTTLERDINRCIRGKSVLEHYNKPYINLKHANALKYLETNEIAENFDFIFLDAVKREYIEYKELLKKALKPGGVLVCDNIFFNGKVVENDDDIDHRYKQGVALLRKFNNELLNDTDFFTFFNNVGDGISVSIKK